MLLLPLCQCQLMPAPNLKLTQAGAGCSVASSAVRANMPRDRNRFMVLFSPLLPLSGLPSRLRDRSGSDTQPCATKTARAKGWRRFRTENRADAALSSAKNSLLLQVAHKARRAQLTQLAIPTDDLNGKREEPRERRVNGGTIAKSGQTRIV